MDLSLVGMAHCGTSFQGELAKSTSTATFTTNDLASVQASHKTWIFEVPVHDDVRRRRHRIVRRAGRQAAFGVEAVGAGPNTESPSSSKHNIFRKCAQRRQLLMIIGDKCSVCTLFVG